MRLKTWRSLTGSMPWLISSTTLKGQEVLPWGNKPVGREEKINKHTEIFIYCDLFDTSTKLDEYPT